MGSSPRKIGVHTVFSYGFLFPNNGDRTQNTHFTVFLSTFNMFIPEKRDGDLTFKRSIHQRMMIPIDE